MPVERPAVRWYKVAMTDHDALLRAIAENPDEDTPRLAFDHGR